MAGSQDEEPEVDELEESLPARRDSLPKASVPMSTVTTPLRQRAEVVVTAQASTSAVPMSAAPAVLPPVARNPKAEALLALAPRSLLFKNENVFATRNIHDRYVSLMTSKPSFII